MCGRELRDSKSSQEEFSGGSQLAGPKRVVEVEEGTPGDRNKMGTEGDYGEQ